MPKLPALVCQTEFCLDIILGIAEDPAMMHIHLTTYNALLSTLFYQLAVHLYLKHPTPSYLMIITMQIWIERRILTSVKMMKTT